MSFKNMLELGIENLTCKYGDKVVLRSSAVRFEAGKVYFLLGKSGAGKSTFLEALGLMTETMTTDSKVFFRQKDKEVNLPELWSSSDEKISGFRDTHYSFIFQSTNLMGNFTAGENMCFTKMLSGSNYQEAKTKVLELMKDVDLPAEVFDSHIQNLSGGQRQRLAFVRALTAPHDIIFCDEPTGNLDEVVAHKLLKQLKSKVIKEGKIAIVVSHDIKLAVKFADELFYAAFSSEELEVGIINNQSKYTKEGDQWTDFNGDAISDLAGELIQKIAL